MSKSLYELLEEIKKLKTEISLLKAKEDRDHLTGLLNRGALRKKMLSLDRVKTRKKRLLDKITRRKVFFLMVDVDYFKRINDTHGHPVGDKVLQMVAQRIQNSLRYGDLVYRYGGEEFCVIIECSTIAQAVVVANKIRKNIDCEPRDLAEVGAITVSIGLAILSNKGSENSLKIADDRLIRAKSAGRDRVVYE